MRKFLNLDSPFMMFLSNLTDIVILNVLFLLCCIPVITIGPAITAMHYVTLKMVKDEDGYLLKSFFKAFKENFKQSCAVWMVFLAITVVFLLDYKILKTAGMEENKIFMIVIGAIYLFICITAMYVFPLLSRFENTLKQTVKNALLMSILHIFKTVIMAVIYVVPFVLAPMHYNLLLVFLIIGVSGPAYINSFIWRSIFKKYEPEEIIEDELLSEEEFHIAEE